eukprot:GSChrysophyteH1.ASY1.ANO1.2827.1 assembled CDS
MPKNDVGGHRAMANQQKSRGLGQLQYYCQMCHKQCRDADGFKCHINSESHLRNMQLFVEDSGGMIDDFSKQFQKGFLRILFHRHGTKRVEANKVYQEYIADRHHVHMNSTTWATLTDFCKYLGKESLAVVDETEHGWWIRYIDRDPRVVARQEAELAHRKEEMNDVERSRRRIKAQMDAAVAAEASQRDGEVKEVKIELGAARKKPKRMLPSVVGEDEEQRADSLRKKEAHQQERQEQPQHFSAEQVSAPPDAWLLEGIFVRVLNKKLHGGTLYKKKGRVLRVLDSYVGEVLVDGDVRVRIDQQELETVVPKEGKNVRFVSGPHRRCEGLLTRIDQDTYSCTVRISDGPHQGLELGGVEFEQISRV